MSGREPTTPTTDTAPIPARVGTAASPDKIVVVLPSDDDDEPRVVHVVSRWASAGGRPLLILTRDAARRLGERLLAASDQGEGETR